jgi:hypothetical protein
MHVTIPKDTLMAGPGEALGVHGKPLPYAYGDAQMEMAAGVRTDVQTYGCTDIWMYGMNIHM